VKLRKKAAGGRSRLASRSFSEGWRHIISGRRQAQEAMNKGKR